MKNLLIEAKFDGPIITRARFKGFYKLVPTTGTCKHQRCGYNKDLKIKPKCIQKKFERLNSEKVSDPDFKIDSLYAFVLMWTSENFGHHDSADYMYNYETESFYSAPYGWNRANIGYHGHIAPEDFDSHKNIKELKEKLVSVI